jgi:hypothetical protein
MQGRPIGRDAETSGETRRPDRFAPLAPRDPATRVGRFHRGAHSPFAIRWFGVTALVGHLRHLVAVAAASQQLDLRDWMRPESGTHLLDRVSRVLGAAEAGGSLAERLGRPVWIDFVCDTGDDYDLSLAVGRMVLSEHTLAGEEARRLPRGDVLIFGGDIAYPLSTGYELERRLLGPWNAVLQERAPDPRGRVLLGIPGNHDWYDGLDGFGRLFRRNPLEDLPEPVAGAPAPAPSDSAVERVEGALVRQLHIDELAESLRLAGEAWEALAAILGGSTVRKAGRLGLAGYRAVQEASYWALPLAPGLDLWGIDRQLRRADFRQRVFFAQRRGEVQPPRILLVAPDPALAYGEPNEPGMQLLDACHLSLDTNRILYLTGDVHHYERQAVADSLHVIAGGGGAFLHGSRIAPDAGSAPPVVAYPDKSASLRLALGMPLRLMLGTAGFLPHGLFALLAAIELTALRRGPWLGAIVMALATLGAMVALSSSVRARRVRPAATWGIAVLFGLMLSLLLLGCYHTLGSRVPWLGVGPAVLAYAFVASFVLGLFLLVLALLGLEHHQGFAVLGHPGFRHFVRLCVDPTGRVEGFVIGKDDPLGNGLPVLVDRFTWD